MADANKKSPVDEAAVRAGLKEVAKQIDTLMPHINKAQQAFGGLDDHQAALTDLKNKVAKAQAVYGS
jgi:hypothetical protein